mmetsp:Transcript_50027/g.106445  ORF Transcript_50027/g.106445 Transcript_50027/m.106445 type:complete len:217 (-) Transcript_50027:162-812(-)
MPRCGMRIGRSATWFASCDLVCRSFPRRSSELGPSSRICRWWRELRLTKVSPRYFCGMAALLRKPWTSYRMASLKIQAEEVVVAARVNSARDTTSSILRPRRTNIVETTRRVFTVAPTPSCFAGSCLGALECCSSPTDKHIFSWGKTSPSTASWEFKKPQKEGLQNMSSQTGHKSTPSTPSSTSESMSLHGSDEYNSQTIPPFKCPRKLWGPARAS